MNSESQEGNEKRDSIVYEKAYAVAIRIVKAYRYLCEAKKDYVLSKQLLNSGTSIASNLMEGLSGISTADFSARISISYKESQETKYWLSLLKDTDYIDEKSYYSIYADVDEVCAMLYAILKKTRIQGKEPPPQEPTEE